MSNNDNKPVGVKRYGYLEVANDRDHHTLRWVRSEDHERVVRIAREALLTHRGAVHADKHVDGCLQCEALAELGDGEL